MWHGVTLGTDLTPIYRSRLRVVDSRRWPLGGLVHTVGAVNLGPGLYVRKGEKARSASRVSLTRPLVGLR